MATVSKSEIDTEKGLAEYIISHYNSRLKCLSCNIVRSRGAFNRDQAGKNKDNEPSRRYVCKGKTLNQCGKTYSPRNLWLLAQAQLDPEELLALRDLFPIATGESLPLASEIESQQSVDDPMPLKRHRDSSPTGLTPTSKRVTIGIDRVTPPSFSSLVSMMPSDSQLSSSVSSEPSNDLSLSSVIPLGHINDLNCLSQLLDGVKRRIGQLELEKRGLSPSSLCLTKKNHRRPTSRLHAAPAIHQSQVHGFPKCR